MSKKNDAECKFFGNLVFNHMVVLILKIFCIGCFCSPPSMLGGALFFWFSLNQCQKNQHHDLSETWKIMVFDHTYKCEKYAFSCN